MYGVQPAYSANIPAREACPTPPASAQSHTPLNILSGFKKASIYSFNPGESERYTAHAIEGTKETHLFSSNLFWRTSKTIWAKPRYTEGYDLPDPAYLLTWHGKVQTIPVLTVFHLQDHQQQLLQEQCPLVMLLQHLQQVASLHLSLWLLHHPHKSSEEVLEKLRVFSTISN